MSEYLEFAKRTAQEAGEKVLEFYQKKKVVAYQKSEIDFSLEADLEVEKFIKQKIATAYPTHSILAEETGESDKESDFKWVVDPIDGTANFKQGIAYFCTTIALQHKGEIVIAVVYDPVVKELFHAQKGGGAYLNDKKIQVSNIDNIRQFLVSYSTSNHRDEEAVEAGSMAFHSLLQNCRAVRLRGSSILDLCNLAQGTFDALIKVKAKYWDFAAGCLIVEEAGGTVTNWDNSPWSESTVDIAASNGQLHQKFLRVLLS